MTLSRRDLPFLLPALSAASSLSQQPKNPATAASVSSPVLESKAYAYDQLEAHTSANGMTSRSVFNGTTTRGQRVTLHISELAPGQAPHPPARQPHEEIIIIREGTLEVTLNGQTSTLGPGSVIFSTFNNLTGWRNVGTSPAQYYVLGLEEHSA